MAQCWVQGVTVVRCITNSETGGLKVDRWGQYGTVMALVTLNCALRIITMTEMTTILCVEISNIINT